MSSRRHFVIFLVVAMLMLTSNAWAQATGFTTSPPNTVSTTLEACRNTGQVPLYDASSPNPLICFDSAYTTGNLGKGWNELDLVPHRLTLTNNKNGGDVTYNIIVAGDYTQGTAAVGYDVITTPAVNAAKSSNTCSVSDVSGGQQTVTGATGGTDTTIYRTLQVSQGTDSTCVLDFDMRLALGAHNFPGSSLQSYKFEDSSFKLGKATISIPVKEIAPQELSKKMTASQSADHAWTVSKTVPASLTFPDICDPNQQLPDSLKITVKWSKTKVTPGGPITVTAVISATNPAARTVTVTVTDTVYLGTTQTTQVHQATSAPIDIPANTTMVVFTDTFTDNTNLGATDYNDVAVGSYVDKLTGVVIPQTTKATATSTVQVTGQNDTASIVDKETISGTGFKFSVDSIDPASSGSFTSGGNTYTLPGGQVTEVTWTSGTLSSAASDNDSGSFTFTKTVNYSGSGPGTGTLSDQATLTASDGFTVQSDAKTVSLAADASVSLEIDKTINPSATQSFKFDVLDSANNKTVVTIPFTQGDVTTKSSTLSNLTPDTYKVTEEAVSGWSTDATTHTFVLDATSASKCSAKVSFTNNQKPTLTVIKVVNNNHGGTLQPSDFPLTVNGNAVNSGDKNVEDPGDYTAAETQQPGYHFDGFSGDCDSTGKVTLNYGDNKTCTLTNSDLQAYVIVTKVVNNTHGGTAKPDDFKLTLDGTGTTSGTKVAVTAGSHTAAETLLSGYTFNGYSGDCDSTGKVTVALGETKTCTLTNSDQQSYVIVNKVVNNNHGGTAKPDDFKLTLDGTGTTSGTKVAVTPGSHTAAETLLYGYTFNGYSGDCDSTGKVTVALGQTKTCTLTNSDKGGTIIIQKNADPASGVFAFQVTGTGYNGFSLNGGPVTGQKNTQSGLSAGTYTVKELTQLGWTLTAIGGDPNNPGNCVVTGTGGSTGSGDAVNTQTATINLKNGDTVTCVFENTGNGATRTQGFWATHPQLASIAWFGGSGFGHSFPGVAGVSGIGDRTLCGRPIDTLNKLMGGFWSSVSSTSTGKKRSSLDQGRMQLLQQLLAAELNASAFGSSPGSGSFAGWESAYCGTNTSAISTAQQQAGSFNSKGDSSTFTPGTAADSKTARAIALYTWWDVLP